MQPNLSRVFDDAYVVSGHAFPVEHKQRAIDYAKAEAVTLRNSVPVLLRNTITGDMHCGFFHPDGHHSHYSLEEERRGLKPNAELSRVAAREQNHE